MKSCFFIGHRESSSEVLPYLRIAVEQHISRFGAAEFFVGNYGGFDRMVAKVLREAKEHHPQILLLLLTPYHPAERAVSLPEGFDNSFYPPGMEGVPRNLAIVRANRYMVDHTDFLIANVRHPASNSGELLAYAKRRERRQELRITLLGRKGK